MKRSGKPKANPFQSNFGAVLPAEYDSNKLFTSDPSVRDDFFATFRSGYKEPEKLLMLAVLEEALWCLEKCPADSSPASREKLYNEARDWVLSEDAGWIFSFVQICAHLGFDHEYIRKGLSVKFKLEIQKAAA